MAQADAVGPVSNRSLARRGLGSTAERDPNGDGAIDNPAGNAVTGGYLKQTTRDTVSDPARNSGTNPTPASIRNICMIPSATRRA